MSHSLSKGALSKIMNGQEYKEPVVQILSIKRMGTTGEPEKDRIRAYISDGQHTVTYAMMTAPLYAKVGDKGLPKFSIIQIRRFMTSVINSATEGKDSRVLLILDLKLLQDGDEVGSVLGNPVQLPYNDVNNKRSSDSSPPPAKLAKIDNITTNTSNNRVIHPISSLSPYHNKWVIRVRVINKSDIRKWDKPNGSGQLFSFDVADSSGEIRVTAFRDLVDKYYDFIKIDKVYYISRCQIKPANKNFNTLNNEYEMTLNSESLIEECEDTDEMDNVQVHYKFVNISNIADMAAGETLDVMGVVTSVGDLQVFNAKSTGRELKKRELRVIDQSNAAISVVLWGNQAETFEANDNPVLAIKGARIGEFAGGKSISLVSGSIMKINPETKECFHLKGWYEKEGRNMTANDLSARTQSGGSVAPWKCFKEVFDQRGGLNDGDSFFQLKGTVLLIRSENIIYKACPLPECNKKVVEGSGYRCEKCQKDYEDFKWRYLCNLNIGDWSGSQWVSMFNEQAEKVIGSTAQEAGALLLESETKLREALEGCHFKEYIFTMRTKMETFNDEQRLKTVVTKVMPINHREYQAHLISKIQKLSFD